MDAGSNGEMVWHRQGDRIVLSFIAPGRSGRNRSAPLRFGGMLIYPVLGKKNLKVVYAQPLQMAFGNGQWESRHPAVAILGGAHQGDFSGSRANFRDIIRVAQSLGRFVYVVAPNDVTNQAVWNGYVRIGYQRWIRVPCPRPSAIYNRVPTRNAEKHPSVVSAKHKLKSQGIPMFNPEYFNKRVIYGVLERSGAATYLPESMRLDGASSLTSMLERHDALYLKPTGGSIGHGIMRLDRINSGAYRLSVVKNTRCNHHRAHSFSEAWSLVQKHRLQGEYIIQAGKHLIQYQGRSCDFRVLLQKSQSEWGITGIGVRVSGPDTITTHVPNGGFIASANAVLDNAFKADAAKQRMDLERMVLACARVIDSHYDEHLGEMSMDVGMDRNGGCWFFEANAKPMKFDEPDIREKSIMGILNHLEYLATRGR